MAPSDEPAPRRGLTYDEFELGDSHRSPARTVTESDVATFAGLSGDYNPLHTDQEYALKTPFRGRIAHGLLVQSIASGLANQMGIFDGTVAALKEMLIRYKAPVRPGDTIHLRLTVQERDPEPSARRGWVRFAATVQNQKDEVVIDGEWLTLLLRKRQSA